MLLQPRRQRRALTTCVLIIILSLPAWAADKTRLHVDDYQISVELTPHTHKLSAHVIVKFTALEDLNIATFNLHNDLRVTKVTDATGKALSAERVTQDSSVRMRTADKCDFFSSGHADVGDILPASAKESVVLLAQHRRADSGGTGNHRILKSGF